MSGLRQSSKVLNNLGSLHIIFGRIRVTTNVWSLSVNDPTTTLTDIGPGNVSLNFGENFIGVPRIAATISKATHEAAVVKDVLVESSTVSACEFVHHSLDDTGAGETDSVTVDPDDGDGWNFIVIGERLH